MLPNKKIKDREASLRYYSFEELQDCADNDFENLNAIKLARTPPHEIGAWLERFSLKEREIILGKLSDNDVTEVLAEMNVFDSAEIVGEMRDAKAIKILSSLAPDDVANLVGELEDDIGERLRAKMPSHVATTLRYLLTYDPNNAGGVMTPRVATLKIDMLVDEAIEFLRKTRTLQKMWRVYISSITKIIW
jgi:Mg/Co/Ni transporter MgtE